MIQAGHRSTDWRDDPITPKQARAIKLIFNMLGVGFNGLTKGQASAFIGTHYDEAKRIRDGGTNKQKVTNRKMAWLVLEEDGPWEDYT